MRILFAVNAFLHFSNQMGNVSANPSAPHNQCQPATTTTPTTTLAQDARSAASATPPAATTAPLSPFASA